MSSVPIIPGASAEKLPFLHSKFKARSKLAKTFGGCNRFFKARLTTTPEDPEEDLKLPRITYNARDSRTLITFNSTRRGSRREYAGFTGVQKNNRRKQTKNSLTSSKSSEDLTNADLSNGRKWGSRESLASSRSETGSNLPLKELRHNNTAVSEELLQSLNSLFIINEASFEGGNSPRNANNNISQENSEALVQKEIMKLKEATIFETDPFAKGFGKKLRGSRGNSGVKRSKRDKHDQRILGDLITTKRLKEIMSPRNTEISLKFG